MRGTKHWKLLMNFIFLLQICSGISMEIYIKNLENVLNY